jgi:competence protein ComEA
MKQLRISFKRATEFLSSKTGLNQITIAVLLVAILISVVLGLAYLYFFNNAGFQISSTDIATKTKEIAQDGQLSTEFDEQPQPDPISVTTAVVYVTGAVNNPGLYTLLSSDRVGDAVTAAGGMNESAAVEAVNLAEFLSDGIQIHILTREEAQANISIPSSSSGSIATTGSTKTGQDQTKININTADVSNLQALDGIGPATAQKIIDYRTANGSFKSKEDLKNVSGIGDKKYAAIEAKITV